MEGGVRDSSKTRQTAASSQKNAKKEKAASMMAKDNKDSDDEDDEEDDEKGADGDKAKSDGNRRDSIASEASEAEEKKLQNQFSFVERATQTMNNALKADDVQTEPPPRANFSDTVNQWVIYDAYVSYEYQKELQDEKERLRGKKEDTNQSMRRILGKCHIAVLKRLSPQFLDMKQIGDIYLVCPVYYHTTQNQHFFKQKSLAFLILS